MVGRGSGGPPAESARLTQLLAGKLSNPAPERSETALKTNRPVNAAIAWSTLGAKWLEMMSASGHVIARRSSRSNTPAQLFGMGSEKVQAALEAGHAMSRRMVGMPLADPLAMWTAWARVLGSGMAPYHARAVRNARSGRRSR